MKVAQENAVALGATQVEFIDVAGDEFVPASLPPVDLIVSNPPYVPQRVRAGLSADVRDFEPHAALFGGPDGIEVIRALLQVVPRRLRPGGALVMEIGADQAEEVSIIVAGAGMELDTIRPDLQGIPRVVVAHRPPGR
jgi:release factor glutamine methyltransferase